MTTTAKTYKTIADLLTGAKPEQLAARTAGSTTELGIDSIPEDREVEEFRPTAGALDIARYFRVETPELGGRVGAVKLGDLTREQLAKLSTRNDIDPSVPAEEAREHGVEFYLDINPEDAELPSVDYVTVILGPVNDAGDLGLWTWFPGDVAGTATARGKATGTPFAEIAVKLHNGAR